jgi:prepilin-type N-terminal cleavage/methylation domain-containing protein
MVHFETLRMHRVDNSKGRRFGFTLIELLMVIGIIGVLIGILAPVLSAARSRGKRTVCASNLRQLMTGMRSYLDASGDIYPYASYMPSVDPYPIQADDDNEANGAIVFADVLAPHLGDDSKAFNCPADYGGIDRGLPNGTQPYYVTEKSSYEYRYRLGGRSLKQVLDRRAEFMGRRTSESIYWIFRDIDNFHGPAGKPGARRYVYNDGHVADFEQ